MSIFETSGYTLDTASFSIRVSICVSVHMSINMAVGNATWLFRSGFLIRLEVEIDEKPQVAGEQTAAKQCGVLFACAVAEVREMWVIAVSKMLVG